MIWTYAVSALCLFVCMPFYMHYKHAALRLNLAVAYKGLGTLCAVSMALTAAVKLDPRCWVCFAALLLHTAADVLLEFNLYAGAGLFLAGHICYIAFFTNLFPVTSVHFIVAVGLIAVAAVIFWRWRKNIGKQMPMFAVYAVTLVVMCSCAIGGLTAGTLQGQLIAAGGALFLISDSLLLKRLLFPCGRSVDWAIIFLYYIAQLLFGYACLI